MLERWLEWVAGFVARRYVLVLVIAALLTAVAGYGVSKLDVLASRTALYPDDLEVNKRFNEFLTEFGTTGNLVVVLEGQPQRQGEFARRLADKLALRTDVISGVFYRTDLEFFARHLPLYVPFDSLKEGLDKLETATADVDGEGPIDGLVPLLSRLGQMNVMSLGGGSDPSKVAQALGDVAAELDKVQAMVDGAQPVSLDWLSSLMEEPLKAQGLDPEGYLRSKDGEMMFLFVQPVQSSDEYDVLRPFVTAVEEGVASIQGDWDGDRITVGLTGLPMNSVEETESIRRDVLFTVVVAAIAILLIILIGFRSIRRGIVVFIPLLMAGVWNLGITAGLIGYLTLLTSGFTAILFGLGVDYGIFLSGLIQEGMGRGLPREEALKMALKRAGRTVVTAGLTTASAFFLIGTVEFKGFAELGVVAGIGVLMVILSTLFVLPAMTLVIPLPPSRAPKVGANRERRVRFAWGTIVLAALLSVGAGIGASRLEMDFDVQNIMPKGSQSVEFARKMAENSDFKAELIAIPVENLTESRRVSKALRQLPTIARVQSVDELVPESQDKKLALLKQDQAALKLLAISGEVKHPVDAQGFDDAMEPLVDALLDGQDQAFSAGQKELVGALEKVLVKVEALRDTVKKSPEAVARLAALEEMIWGRWGGMLSGTMNWTHLSRLTLDELPKSLRDRFQGKGDRLAVFAFPKGSIYDVDTLDKMLAQVYEVAPQATGFPSTHQVFSRMIMDGFKQATMLAGLVVLLLMILEFRRPRKILLALLPLTLGGLWMFGAMWLLGLRLNYANIIALPMVIGLAVDYGVYLTHRLNEEEGASSSGALKRGVTPVVLAALTTAAGVGAICLGEHQGAASLGTVLLIGIGTCLLGALWVIPAVDAVTRRR